MHNTAQLPLPYYEARGKSPRTRIPCHRRKEVESYGHRTCTDYKVSSFVTAKRNDLGVTRLRTFQLYKSVGSTLSGDTSVAPQSSVEAVDGGTGSRSRAILVKPLT